MFRFLVHKVICFVNVRRVQQKIQGGKRFVEECGMLTCPTTENHGLPVAQGSAGTFKVGTGVREAAWLRIPIRQATRYAALYRSVLQGPNGDCTNDPCNRMLHSAQCIASIQ